MNVFADPVHLIMFAVQHVPKLLFRQTPNTHTNTHTDTRASYIRAVTNNFLRDQYGHLYLCICTGTDTHTHAAYRHIHRRITHTHSDVGIQKYIASRDIAGTLMLSLCGFPIASVYFKSCYWTIVNILYQHETIPPKLNFLHTRVKTGKGHCPLVNDYHVCNNKLQSYFVLPLHKHSHTYCLHTRTYTPTKRFRRAGLYFDKDALTAVWIY